MNLQIMKTHISLTLHNTHHAQMLNMISIFHFVLSAKKDSNKHLTDLAFLLITQFQIVSFTKLKVILQSLVLPAIMKWFTTQKQENVNINKPQII